ncbi:ankyrin repeat domain-containing protein [Wolbachia endosymbiont of Drosophila incompta]|uniref:ankyrin repeat domain-containing protein n=1 Tax=Wolbachia endosymbiont of Drosophila incompta TaxID=1633785 RepID=UPI000AC3B526|nr:ankyrin repeat domain-containing protein [Wolbachia endosymbiont of Drosophila incompta]
MSSSQSRDNFFKAVERGDIDAVNRLISEGADVKVENDKGGDSFTFSCCKEP